MKLRLVRASLALGLAVVAGSALLASPAQAQDWHHGWHHPYGGWRHPYWHRPPPYYGYGYPPPAVYAPPPPPYYAPPPGINVVIPIR